MQVQNVIKYYINILFLRLNMINNCISNISEQFHIFRFVLATQSWALMKSLRDISYL